MAIDNLIEYTLSSLQCSNHSGNTNKMFSSIHANKHWSYKPSKCFQIEYPVCVRVYFMTKYFLCI